MDCLKSVLIGRGDFVIVRTGQMERCLKEGEWGGYAGGDAPGVKPAMIARAKAV